MGSNYIPNSNITTFINYDMAYDIFEPVRKILDRISLLQIQRTEMIWNLLGKVRVTRLIKEYSPEELNDVLKQEFSTQRPYIL